MTIMNKLRLLTFFSLMALVLFALPALGLAEPRLGEMGFQDAATPSAERIFAFHHDVLLPIITAIVVFVTLLLVWVMIRYNARVNPVPSMTTHNVLLEIIWTVIPVVILIVIAVPSFKLLYYVDRTDKPEMTLKVTGYQWYWGYEYPDNGGVNFLSNMLTDDQIDHNKGQIRLLSTDNPVVLPVDTNIQILVTGSDVIHSFAVPSFGIKTDAVPGRTNETWARITKPGHYYGQCDQLCGKNHAFMPIEVVAVSKEDFVAWVAKQNGGKTPDDTKGAKTQPPTNNETTTKYGQKNLKKSPAETQKETPSSVEQ